MNALTETWVVFSHEARRSARSAKTLVLLILYSLASVISGLIFVAASRKAQEGLATLAGGQQIPADDMVKMKMGALSLFFGKEEELLRYLADIPLVVLFFYKFALFFLPLLIALMGFDQISGELSSRSIRYVSLRARRGSLLAGKVIAQAAVLLGLTAVMNLGVFAYAAATTENFAVGAGLAAMARFWLLALVYTSTYLGLTALCSALFRTPIVSLLTSLCALFVFWLLAMLGKFEKLAFLSWATPSHYEDGLVSLEPLQALGAAGAYVLFAAAFLGLAYLALRRRDL
jgi:ABC-2 type transport system permease protein